MTRAGKQIIGQRRTSWLNALFVILTLLAIAGGGVATDALLDMLNSAESGGLRRWLPFVGALAAGGLMLGWQAMSYAILAKVSVASRFNHGPQVMTASPRGITLENGTGLWETRWEGVEAVVTGKTGIGFVVSGIVLPVPRSALSEPELARITRWMEAAR